MAWDDDLAALNAATRDVFGKQVSVAHLSGLPAYTITAIFTEAHALVDLQGTVPVSSTGPVLDVNLADAREPFQQGDVVTLVASGAAFEVIDLQPDGHERVRLILVKQ